MGEASQRLAPRHRRRGLGNPRPWLLALARPGGHPFTIRTLERNETMTITIRYIALIALSVYLVSLNPPAWGIVLMAAVLVATVAADVVNARREGERQ